MIVAFISLFYLLLWGFVSIHGRVGKAGIGERPTMYESVFIQGILTLFLILFLISTIALLIFNWKLTILLFIIGMLTSRIIFDPLVERIFLLPLVSYLLKKGKDMEMKENNR